MVIYSKHDPEIVSLMEKVKNKENTSEEFKYLIERLYANAVYDMQHEVFFKYLELFEAEFEKELQPLLELCYSSSWFYISSNDEDSVQYLFEKDVEYLAQSSIDSIYTNLNLTAIREDNYKCLENIDRENFSLNFKQSE